MLRKEERGVSLYNSCALSSVTELLNKKDLVFGEGIVIEVYSVCSGGPQSSVYANSDSRSPQYEALPGLDRHRKFVA